MSHSSHAPLISTEDYNLLLGAKPPTPELIPISFAEREELLDLVIAENIEYRYINGSCEDRAHYISLLLKKHQVTAGKIWNFAPARYSLSSDELFNMTDPLGISENTTWGYHVAPFLTAYNQEGEVETLVIDQSLSANTLLTIDEWLALMNCPRSIYLLTDADSYLFFSLNNYLMPDESAPAGEWPAFLPSIITGNFWNLAPGDDYVQKGLSINDLAIEIFSIKNQLPAHEATYLHELLKNIDDVIRLTEVPRPDELSPQTYRSLIRYYDKRYAHWNDRVAHTQACLN
ncbi:MAG: protein-glutamine glutaminase family protein [Marinoscillum sp.]|uniref:protein-glutamine glutaminase family protein n=1 Tax=Marinoscillum sp. TaxID=2024838 RepID=UPI0032FE6E89